MFCGMLVIRMQRTGRRNDASFRIVVTEHTAGPKSNKHVEVLGSYHPKTKAFSVDAERVTYWMSVGAGLSDSLHNLLVNQNVIEGDKRNVLPKKTPIVSDEPEEAAATEEAAPAQEGGEEAAAEEAPAEEKEEAPAEEPAAEETPAEEAASEKEEEAPSEESASEETPEAPAEEAPEEEKKEATA